MEQSVNQLSNPNLSSDLQNGTFNDAGSLLYTIEKSADKYNKFWELSICHDLLEGFNGQDIQELGNYVYPTKEAAEADLQLMNETKDFIIYQF